MTWRDDLMPAKLDDVEFLYRGVRDRGGRRVIPYEFPGRDDPYIEDLGAKAKTWQVEAFLIGPFYHVALADLIDVLDKPGTRKFQHPYRGEFPVKLLGEYEIAFSDTEGGMAKISFTLMEAGLAFPLIAVDTGVKLASLAKFALGKLPEKTKFNLLNAIKDVINSVLGALGTGLSTINAVNGKIAAALSLADTASFLIDSIAKGLGNLVNSPFALMSALNNLLSSVIGLVTGFIPPDVPSDTIAPPVPLSATLMSAFNELTAFQAIPATVPTNTPQSDIEILNFQAVNFGMKAATVAVVADALAVIPLESSDEAAAIQAQMVKVFDEVLAEPDIDVDVFEAFAALKAATVDHLSIAQQNLPALASYTPKQTMPALVIAYELYGDATRDAEIIVRNKVRHPSFVPGGKTLQVISDD